MKLSKIQLEVLKELATTETTIHCLSGLDTRYFFSGSMKTVKNSTMGVLLDKGLVEKFDRFANLGSKVRLTDLGKKLWLEESKNG
jgi:hypothetical protein